MTPEGKIKSDIVKYLSSLKKQKYPIDYDCRQAGGFAYRMGLPDIYVVYKWYHIEIEVKVPNQGKLSAMQEKRAEKYKLMKTPHIIATSVNDVKQLMSHFLDENDKIDRF